MNNHWPCTECGSENVHSTVFGRTINYMCGNCKTRWTRWLHRQVNTRG